MVFAVPSWGHWAACPGRNILWRIYFLWNNNLRKDLTKDSYATLLKQTFHAMLFAVTLSPETIPSTWMTPTSNYLFTNFLVNIVIKHAEWCTAITNWDDAADVTCVEKNMVDVVTQSIQIKFSHHEFSVTCVLSESKKFWRSISFSYVIPMSCR